MKISNLYWKSMAAIAVFLGTGSAHAAGTSADFNDVGQNIVTASDTAVMVIQALAVVGGLGLVAHGVWTIKESKQAGGNKGLAMLEILIGVLMVSIVTVVFLVSNTVIGDVDASSQNLLNN